MKSFRLSVLIAIALALIIGTGVSVQAGSGEKNTSPSVNGKYDLGTSTRAWKDLRITGSVYSDGTAVITDGTIAGDVDLATGKILIGDAAGASNAVTPSGDWTMTGAGVSSLAVNTVDSAEIVANAVAASEIADSTITADQMAADSVDSSELIDNSVGARQLNVTVKTVTIADSATSGTATVTVGSLILGVYGFANIDDIGAEMVNSASISSTTLTLVTNGTVSGAVVYKVPVMEP